MSVLSECSGPLGMEGGIISNQQITASSTHRALFGLQKWYPYFARLNKKGLVNAWTAAENDRWPWIQVRQIPAGRHESLRLLDRDECVYKNRRTRENVDLISVCTSEYWRQCSINWSLGS